MSTAEITWIKLRGDDRTMDTVEGCRSRYACVHLTARPVVRDEMTGQVDGVTLCGMEMPRLHIDTWAFFVSDGITRFFPAHFDPPLPRCRRCAKQATASTTP